MLPLYIVTNFLHCSLHSFWVWYWKLSLFCLHTEKTQFTQEQPIWSFRRKLSSATCRKPATVCFVHWGEMMIPKLIHIQPEWTRQPPPVHTHTKEGWMVGGWTQETFFLLRSSSLSNLIWTQLRVHQQTRTEWWEASDDGWCAAGGYWLSLTHTIFWNSTSNNHVKTLKSKFPTLIQKTEWTEWCTDWALEKWYVELMQALKYMKGL